MNTLNAAVIGAGVIGMDLLHRIEETDGLSCGMVIGRKDSRSLRQANDFGYPTTDEGLESVVSAGMDFDVVFDASDADSHLAHWTLLQPTSAFVVDLTPSGVGHAVVPTVNPDNARDYSNASLISCAAQATIPVLNRLCPVVAPHYTEVVVTVASASVGPATRRNLDRFIETSRAAIARFADLNLDEVKFMGNVSPAQPAPTFRVLMTMLHDTNLDEARLQQLVAETVDDVQSYAAGYQLRLDIRNDQTLTVTAEVAAHGGSLPSYAGNLEIINAAAVAVALRHRRSTTNGGIHS